MFSRKRISCILNPASLIGVRVAALIAGLVVALPGGRAMAAPQPSAPPPPAATAAAVRPLSEVLNQLGRRVGVLIVTDPIVGDPPVPAAVAVPAGTAPMGETETEQRIAQIVGTLPAGRSATWTKLHLPPPPPGRTWTGEAVAAFARAQTALFGPAATATATLPKPSAAAAGVIEILGQRFEGDTARAYAAGLRLQPVYLITSGDGRAQTGTAAAGPLLSWAQLPPEQREQMAAQILNMDPALRNQMMQGFVGVFMNVMRRMSPEDRAAMFQGTGLNVGNGGATVVRP